MVSLLHVSRFWLDKYSLLLNTSLAVGLVYCGREKRHLQLASLYVPYARIASTYQLGASAGIVSQRYRA